MPDVTAVAGSAQARGAGRAALHGLGRVLGRVLGLAGLAVLQLGAASLMALAAVRVGADLIAGIDPFLPAHRRPFVGAVALARRELAVDILRQVFLAGLVLAAVLWRGGGGWRARLGLAHGEPSRLRPTHLLLVLLLWPVVHIAWVSFSAGLFGLRFGRGMQLSPLLTPGAVAAWLAYVVVLAPMAEELLMRGLLFARGRDALGVPGAILVTALLFALAHAAGWSLARPVSLIPLALALGVLRWRTGRLWPCIVLHGWSNLALIAYMLRPA